MAWHRYQIIIFLKIKNIKRTFLLTYYINPKWSSHIFTLKLVVQKKIINIFLTKLWRANYQSETGIRVLLYKHIGQHITLIVYGQTSTYRCLTTVTFAMMWCDRYCHGLHPGRPESPPKQCQSWWQFLCVFFLVFLRCTPNCLFFLLLSFKHFGKGPKVVYMSFSWNIQC